jgi:hypothetical protein
MIATEGAFLMATGYRAKAAGRSADVEAAIRDALTSGDTREVVTIGCAALRSEATKLRDQRRGDGALTDVELAALLLHTLSRLHAHKPLRPPGCARVPRPADLLAAFDAELVRLEMAGKDGVL